MRPGEAGVSCREDTRVAGGVVAAGAARAGAAYTPRRFVVFLFGKGWGWGREGQDPEGIWRPGELGSAVLFLTAGAVNRPIPACGEPTGLALPASSPGLRVGTVRGGLGARAGRRLRGRRSGPGGAVGGRAG